MDGSLIYSNFTLVNDVEGTDATRDKDPMILAKSYIMYKIGKLLYELHIKLKSIKLKITYLVDK